MLTELQKARTRFHLGYPNDQISGPLLEVTQNLVLGNLAQATELALVGDLGSQTLEFEGQAFCSPTSLLGKVERAWNQLDSDVISDSLFVQVAGSVTLRKDEIKARRELYDELRNQLTVLLDTELFGYSGHSHHYSY